MAHEEKQEADRAVGRNYSGALVPERYEVCQHAQSGLWYVRRKHDEKVVESPATGVAFFLTRESLEEALFQ